MVCVDWVLLIQVDFEEFIMLFASKVLESMGVSAQISRMLGLLMVNYEFTLVKFEFRRPSSVVSIKPGSLPAGTKYLMNSCGP